MNRAVPVRARVKDISHLSLDRAESILHAMQANP
jgi:hypothetical protein